MSKIKTLTALGKLEDTYFLYTNVIGSRKCLKKEKNNNEHPFIKFANAKNLPELMISMDEIYQLNEVPIHREFISDLSGLYKPNIIVPSEAKTISKMFEENPTRTTLAKTEEAIKVWGFENGDKITNGELYICTPLDELLQAKKDLSEASLVLAWLLKKCDLNQLSKFNLKTIDIKSNNYLSEFYKNLLNNTGNEFLEIDINNAKLPAKPNCSQKSKDTISQYISSVFSLLLSDVTKKMTFDLKIYSAYNSIISQIWSFFADGLCETDLKNQIGVCKNCGNFFTLQRSTKQYCSDSCRVIALRN